MLYNNQILLRPLFSSRINIPVTGVHSIVLDIVKPFYFSNFSFELEGHGETDMEKVEKAR